MASTPNTPPAAGQADDAAPDAARVAAWTFLRTLGCSREEADDLAQEAVLSMVQKRPVFASPASRDAWIRQAAKYLFLTSVRTKTRRERLLREHVEPEARAREAEAEIERIGAERGHEAAQAALRRCMDGLDLRSREILELHYRGGLGSVEVGEKLGMSAGAVKTALHRIRERLRECIRARTE